MVMLAPAGDRSILHREARRHTVPVLVREASHYGVKPNMTVSYLSSLLARIVSCRPGGLRPPPVVLPCGK